MNDEDLTGTLTFATVKTTFTTKQSFLASKRHYSKVTLIFISFVEAITSVVQIYTFLFKSIQILWFKSKPNTFKLIQIGNV